LIRNVRGVGWTVVPPESSSDALRNVPRGRKGLPIH
jgi:hypothetical protein